MNKIREHVEVHRNSMNKAVASLKRLGPLLLVTGLVGPLLTGYALSSNTTERSAGVAARTRETTNKSAATGPTATVGNAETGQSAETRNNSPMTDQYYETAVGRLKAQIRPDGLRFNEVANAKLVGGGFVLVEAGCASLLESPSFKIYDATHLASPLTVTLVQDNLSRKWIATDGRYYTTVDANGKWTNGFITGIPQGTKSEPKPAVFRRI